MSKVLERLIELQLKHKKRDVTPMVLDYLKYLKQYDKYDNNSDIAICKVNSGLRQERYYKPINI